MFSKSSKNNLSSHSSGAPGMDVPSIIASDLKIVGNLICGGSLEIEGEIEGNVTCGYVTVRRSGAIKGDVTADRIHVDGEINGLVKGKHITLAETGRVTGVIMYESLSINDGAYIDGQCQSADRVHRGSVEELERSDESEIDAYTVIDDATGSNKGSSLSDKERSRVEAAVMES